MNTPTIRTLVRSLLVGVVVCTVQPSRAAETLCGGFSEASVTNTEVIAAAQFAVKTQAESKWPLIGFVEVLSAQQQVVAGVNYRLRLKVKVGGKDREAEAVVWRKLDGKQELTSWAWKQPIATTATLVANPVEAVRNVLPKGWAILEVKDKTYPDYRPKGEGLAVFLGVSGKKYSKQQYSAVLYIMPPDYDDGGVDPTGGQAQTWPPQLIMTTKDAKLYLWPGPQAGDWKTIQQDLLKALVRNSE